MIEPRVASSTIENVPAASRERGPSALAWISFSAILLTLAIIGLTGMLVRPEPPQGLPDDPSVVAAAELVGGPLPVATFGLRFATSFGEASTAGRAVEPLPAARLAEAGRRLEDARARRDDPRLDALLGHLDLAAHRFEHAERRYRVALSRAPRYGEARLGLGVAMALRAEAMGERRPARRLRLRAIAHLAAVEPDDRFHLPALYDRALLLARAGRHDEARALAARYAELEPASPWTAELHARVGERR